MTLCSDGNGPSPKRLCSRELRRVLGAFATGVTIVSARNDVGDPVGITASSFTSVSLAPPLVLFCVDRSANCFAAVTASSHFAVNVLSADQRDVSDRFASKNANKWAGVPFAIGVGGVPVLENCLANIVCETYAVHEAGDHHIVLGNVLECWSAADLRPLLYYRGAYRRLTDTAAEN